jgi:hypothetical protein
MSRPENLADINWSPTTMSKRMLGGAAIGGLVGGVAGYRATKDEKKKGRNAALGVLGGAGLGALLGRGYHGLRPVHNSPLHLRAQALDNEGPSPAFIGEKPATNPSDRRIVFRTKLPEMQSQPVFETSHKAKSGQPRVVVYRSGDRLVAKATPDTLDVEGRRSPAVTFATRNIRGKKDLEAFANEALEQARTTLGDREWGDVGRTFGEKNASSPMIRSARERVEKIAAVNLGQTFANAGRSAGQFLGRHAGQNLPQVARWAPTAVGAAAGGLIGAARPDLEKEEKTLGARLRGGALGAAAGAGLAEWVGPGRHLSDSAKRLMATGRFTPERAAGAIAGRAGMNLGNAVQAIPGQVAQIPGQIAGSVQRGFGHAKDFVMNPMQSARQVANAAYQPLLQTAQDPMGVLGAELSAAMSNPLAAYGTLQTANSVAQGLGQTEDWDGRQRGLAERTLGAGGQAFGSLAYGHRGVSGVNPIAGMVGSSVGGNVLGSGAQRVGRFIDRRLLGHQEYGMPQQAPQPAPQPAPQAAQPMR